MLQKEIFYLITIFSKEGFSYCFVRNFKQTTEMSGRSANKILFNACIGIYQVEGKK